ncbi:MAG: hypothetical protein JWO95_1231 [Verrucomicrobiales bacterium]|nr:hypothetical protein [Verrucomicrobiales bacterium]
MRRALTIAALLSVTIGAMAEHRVEDPLPSLESVLQRAIETAKHEAENDRLVNQRYQYTRSRVTEYRNGDGEVTKREEKSSAHKLRTNGVPGNSNHARTPAAVTPKQLTEKTPKSATGEHPEVKKDILYDESLYSRFQFTLVRRELVAGRSVLVLDFKPANKKLPVHDFKDRFINLAAGRLWVDEDDSALVKADLHLTEKVNVMAGIVGAVAKFSCTLDRERTADGLWFTHAMNWHLEARALLARRTIDYHEEKTGVQKAVSATFR